MKFLDWLLSFFVLLQPQVWLRMPSQCGDVSRDLYRPWAESTRGEYRPTAAVLLQLYSRYKNYTSICTRVFFFMSKALFLAGLLVCICRTYHVRSFIYYVQDYVMILLCAGLYIMFKTLFCTALFILCARRWYVKEFMLCARLYVLCKTLCYVQEFILCAKLCYVQDFIQCRTWAF